MPQCPHCTGRFEEGVGHICPACGQDVLLPPSRPRAQQGAGPPPLPPRRSKRTVSQAGPSAPIGVPADDVAPNGWGAQPAAAGWRASTPPPLPPRRTKGPPPPPAAKLLLQELESIQTEDTGSIPKAPTVAQAKIDLPPAPPRKRRTSDAFVVAILAVLVLSGLGWALLSEGPSDIQQAQVEVQALRSRKQLAIRAMEEGHDLVVQGEPKAKAAIDAYQRALALDPSLAAAERGLGISFATLEQAQEAIEHYQRYLELAPEASDRADVERTIKKIKKRLRADRR